ncbi:hypothetical protein LT493_19795 [Streptomyces tricolor]|nr:hypothetical protein [Streptomyces tricolor]
MIAPHVFWNDRLGDRRGRPDAHGAAAGLLKSFSAADLGGFAIKAALDRAGDRRRPGAVRDHGPGPVGRRGPDPGPPGRRQGRHPDERPGAHRHRVCLSGLDAIALADQLIRAGEFDTSWRAARSP